MNYKNANIYTEQFRFERGAFSVENGRFCRVLGEAAADAVDLLERGDAAGARQLLISAQQTAEERIVDAVPEHEE